MCDTNGDHQHGSAACACVTASASHEPEHAHSHEHGHSHEHRHSHDRAAAVGAGDAVMSAYGVEGMTCSHCVSSVSKELSRLAGVKNVDIELVAGGISRVRVDSDRALDDGEVAAAIDEAGYDLVGLPR